MVSHSLFKQLVLRVVGFILCGDILGICFLGILESGQTGRTFSLFSRIGLKVA